MNIVDIIILVFLVLSMIIGFLRGFFKQTVTFLGTIFIFVLAYIFKNPLSLLMYKNLPFLKFSGAFEGLFALNILFYEILAFIIAIVVLSIALKIIIKLTGVFEKILKATVVLAIPSKILGLVVGFIQGILILYVAIFVLSIPMLNVPYVEDSKYAKLIVEKTPILSNVTEALVKTFDEIKEISDKTFDKDTEKNDKNREMIEVMLKNDIITTDNLKILVKKGKIQIDNVDELIKKYEED